MDATYKTTKYELALFFISVKTNFGYSAMGAFVLQSETADQISEALSVLLPPFFMTDYSEAEIGAISTVFPIHEIYLCDSTGSSHGSGGLKDESTTSLLMMLKYC